MNYERIISDRRADSHNRKVHVVAQRNSKTLCGKTINHTWRHAAMQDEVHCTKCAELLNRITGGKLSAPTRIVNLKLTGSEYEVISSLKKGETLSQIDSRMGWKRTAGVYLRAACKRADITIPELRSMLPYIQPVNPAGRRRKPTVYKTEYGRWRARYYSNGKKEYLGDYETERAAIEV